MITIVLRRHLFDLVVACREYWNEMKIDGLGLGSSKDVWRENAFSVVNIPHYRNLRKIPS